MRRTKRTEGRRAFLERVAGIEDGGECERLAPLVSLLADGELSADELRLLRPHLRTWLACRARLRDYRAAPAQGAALVPPLALAAGGADAGPLRSLFESVIGATSDRAAALGERLHAATELATGQKLAAVAASTAAIAGGGATVDQLASPDGPPPRDQPADVRTVEDRQPAEPSPEQPLPTTSPAEPAPAPSPVPAPAPAPQPQPAPAPPPAPANEFMPAPPAAPRAAAPAPGTGNSFSPGGRGSSAAEGEFDP